jgi:hypothetical protein
MHAQHAVTLHYYMRLLAEEYERDGPATRKAIKGLFERGDALNVQRIEGI